MKHRETLVVGGVDAHADSHHAAALDERGALLGTECFATTMDGYGELFGWLSSFGKLAVVAVESTGCYAAGLVRYLRSRGVPVLEVNEPHAHARRRLGKSDPIDAELAARVALSGKADAIPKRTDGIVESIRQLRLARQSAVKARSAAMVQLRDLIITAPQPLREQLSEPRTIRGKANLCRRLRPDMGELELPSQSARLALRSLARRIQTLDAEIAALDKQLERLVRDAAPRTTALLGISTGHAGQLLVSAGQNIERLRGESSFAALCGAGPIPASSGKTSRHRLNYGGDRDANRALHLIAVCRLRYCPRTRAYAKRRSAQGKTKPEIIRCLKRYIARQTYRTLTADLTSLRPQQRPSRVTTIYCGAGPIGITRSRT
jgi:transposase